MTIVFDTYTLPAPSNFKEEAVPLYSKTYSLSGTMTVDYRAVRRKWTLGWDWLEKADYDLIRAKYDKQFTSGLLSLTITNGALSVGPISAHLDIGQVQRKYESQWIQGFSVTFEEQDAI